MDAKKTYFAHPTSVIDENVQIGAKTKIWHFSHIMSGARIGSKCTIGQNCVIANVQIGDRVKVQNNVSIYEGVEVESDVFIGPSVVFTNVINPRSFIERKDEFKKTLLGGGCSIGANATIVCGCAIGKYALIGAGAVVNKDVKDFALVVGNPARAIGWVSRCGNRLHFEGTKARDAYDGSEYVLENDEVRIC